MFCFSEFSLRTVSHRTRVTLFGFYSQSSKIEGTKLRQLWRGHIIATNSILFILIDFKLKLLSQQINVDMQQDDSNILKPLVTLDIIIKLLCLNNLGQIQSACLDLV